MMVKVLGAVKKPVNIKIRLLRIKYRNDQYKWEIKLNFVHHFCYFRDVILCKLSIFLISNTGTKHGFYQGLFI